MKTQDLERDYVLDPTSGRYRRRETAAQGIEGGEPPKASPHQARGKQPNATELEARELLRLHFAEFEGASFSVLDGTHTYTPDWYDEATKTAVEVKGEHIHSRDSRIMFDAARKENPDHTWVWIRKRTTGRKGKRWECEIYVAKKNKGGGK